MSAGRAVWVKVRVSDAERAEWHAKARSVGLTLSDLVRRSVGRVRTWTVAHADMERERTHELARIGNNLNQIARWANIHEDERAIRALASVGSPQSRCTSSFSRAVAARAVFRGLACAREPQPSPLTASLGLRTRRIRPSGSAREPCHRTRLRREG